MWFSASNDGEPSRGEELNGSGFDPPRLGACCVPLAKSQRERAYTQMEKVLPLGAPNMESAADWKSQTGKASRSLPS